MSLLLIKLPWFEEYDGTENASDSAAAFLPVTFSDEENGEYDLVFAPVESNTALPLAKLDAGYDAKSGFVSGVTAVFCAKAPDGAFVVVGWYQNARVAALPQLLPYEDENGVRKNRGFSVCANAADTVLLPSEIRHNAAWTVPRGKSGDAKWGFPQAGFWLADEPAASVFRADLEARIRAYNGENLMTDAESDEE